MHPQYHSQSVWFRSLPSDCQAVENTEQKYPDGSGAYTDPKLSTGTVYFAIAFGAICVGGESKDVLSI
jgi:hypothetical protein